MLNTIVQSQFKKDFKKYRHDKKSRAAVNETITLLASGLPLPARYREHLLTGKYTGCWECHCLPDVLLVYRRDDAELLLQRVGSHSELF